MVHHPPARLAFAAGIPLLFGTLLGVGAVASPAAARSDPTPRTLSFDRPGEYSYTVPPGVTALTVTLLGARGGNGTNPGGRGGGTTARLAVTPGQNYHVWVGGEGVADGGDGGFNGGGHGGARELGIVGGGGGGGASDLRYPGNALADRILVAGGGGGGGSYSDKRDQSDGGGGGGASGADGGYTRRDIQVGGHGGSQTAGGAPASSGTEGAKAGQAGVGGVGGRYFRDGVIKVFGIGGGGGGGGYYGGGGGGSAVYMSGGGGGGSGYAKSGIAARLTTGVNQGPGRVTITENPGTPATLSCPHPPVGTVGEISYSLTCDEDGIPPPNKFTLSGEVPPPGPHIPPSTLGFRDFDWGVQNDNQLTRAGIYHFTITASNGVFPDAEVPVTITVNKGATTTRLQASHAESEFGATVSLTATVAPPPSSPAKPTGNVEFYDGSTRIQTASIGTNGQAIANVANLASGQHSIKAVYLGDANDLGSTSSQVPVTVTAGPSRTTVASSANPSRTDRPVTFTASVASSIDPKLAGSGKVQFVVDGHRQGPMVPLVSGTATSPPITDLAVGTHTVAGWFFGSPDLQPSKGSLSPDQVVEKAKQAVKLSLEATPNPQYQTRPVVFTVRATPGSPNPDTPGGVVDLMEGETRLAQATMHAGRADMTLSSLKDGVHQLHAVYGGDATFDAAQSPEVKLRVNDLRAIRVEPLRVTLRHGESAQLRATAYFPDSTEDVTNKVSWTSDDNASVQVSKTGEVTIQPKAQAGKTVGINAFLLDRVGYAFVTVGAQSPAPSPSSTSGNRSP